MVASERAATMVEYAMLLAMIVVVVVAVLGLLGRDLGHMFRFIERQLRHR